MIRQADEVTAFYHFQLYETNKKCIFFSSITLRLIQSDFSRIKSGTSLDLDTNSDATFLISEVQIIGIN